MKKLLSSRFQLIMDLTCHCGKPFSRKDSLKRHQASCDEKEAAKRQKVEHSLTVTTLSGRPGEDLADLVAGIRACTYVK